MDPMTFVLLVGILARITLFITNDFAADKLRTWFVRVWPKKIWATMNYYIECPWCVSVSFVGLLAVYPLWLYDLTWLEIAGIIAVQSLVAGTIQNLKSPSSTQGRS